MEWGGGERDKQTLEHDTENASFAHLAAHVSSGLSKEF